MIQEVFIPILLLFADIVSTTVIVQVILGLLISFNVVNLHNAFVAGIWQALNAILEPILRPIRRILPNTGMIDLSPMALLVGIQIAIILLNYIGNHYG
ncbi:YggT family protein [Novosphingobium umbonatum]|uniref:YggT family protein n=1 Tax=Novosphingobium umbonatum TaxID=1908524 RepID=A0A3S3TST4_9SPHN|nr:YggT family protein [Novosphingobium umbonatum]RVU07699.1 YggT family protein [Novosphingobium umbonatum]